MTGARDSSQLFSVGPDVAGTPSLIAPASFQELQIRELQDIERWLKAAPEVLGEDLKIIASQLSSFDKTSDRPDLLALDRAGKLVVIEIKRDVSGSGQDLQALRYAAYVSTLTAEQVADLYRAYEAKEHARKITAAEARDELDGFLPTGSLDALDEDEQPRVILVAGSFQVGVTNTSLWLIRNFGLDITCVKLTPYLVNGEVMLSSSIVIPLPEAADFEVRLQEKQRAKARSRKHGDRIDFDIVRAFIAAIPEGRWSSYGDVAAAAGAPKGGQALGTWLSRNETDVPPLVYRVLNRHGEVSPGWQAADPSLPSTPEAVQAKLASEGVSFDGNDRASQDQRWTVDDWAAVQASEPST